MYLKVWLSLGSNLGDRIEYLRAGIKSLSRLSHLQIHQSPIYESAPWGGVAKGSFLNQVIALTVDSERLDQAINDLDPQKMIASHELDSELWTKRMTFIHKCSGYRQVIEKLMFYLLLIELSHGRNRNAHAVRWDSRTLDLDILFIEPNDPTSNPTGACLDRYNSLNQYNSPYLELPHPRLHERLFILAPWCDIAPLLYIQSLKATVEELYKNCPQDSSLCIYVP